MNQTFNITRFGRYARYIISANRWYYGVLMVVCIMPTAVLSLFEQGRIACGLTFCATTMLMFLPNIDLSKFGGLRRQIGIPASWVEKLTVEVFVRFAPLVIPFGIHAVFVALGASGRTSYFADGFEKQIVAFWLCYQTLMFLIFLFDTGKKRFNPFGKDVINTNMFMAVYNSVLWFMVGMGSIILFSEKSPITLTTMFSVALVSFVASVFVYRKRKVC